MGFALFGSTSSTKSQQTSNTQNTSVNQNLQDSDGSILGSNNTIVATDYGAIDAARSIAGDSADLASSAIRAVSDASYDSASLAKELSANVLDSTRNALDFGNDALGFVRDSTDDYSQRLADSYAYSLSGVTDFARGIFGDALDVAAGTLERGQNQLGNVVTSLSTIAREQSTTSDERVQNIAKYALYAGAAMVALIALTAFAKR